MGELDSVDELNVLREKTTDLKLRVGSLGTNMLVDSDSGDFVALRRDVLSSEFDQILEARTLERAKYYIKRLERGVRKVRTSSINDINLNRWQEARHNHRQPVGPAQARHYRRASRVVLG